MVSYPRLTTNSVTYLEQSCKILRDATPKSLVILDGKYRPSQLLQVLNKCAQNSAEEPRHT